MSTLELRTFTKDRIDDMIDVLARARANDHHERRMTPEEARERTVLDPDFDREGAWFAMSGDEVVGFGSVLVEKNRVEAGKDDAWVEIDVLPERIGEDIEQALLDKALVYLASRGVGKAKTRSIAADGRKISFLLSNSFTEAHKVYTLVRRGGGELPEVAMAPHIRLERWDLPECSDLQLSAVVDAFNDSFRDHFDFAPERLERFRNIRDCSDDPYMVTVALDEHRIAGLAMSEYSVTYNKEKGLDVGWVVILGVIPGYRRMGLGKALLSDSVRWIIDKGADTVYLGVFAKNEKALGLYQTFGFEKDRESVIYTRRLTPLD